MSPSAPVAPTLLLAGAALLLPAQEQPKTPVFVGGTKLVLVDFVVTGKGEAMVGGLSASDFVVKEDGKIRPIVSFVAFGGGALPLGAGPAEVVVEAFPQAAAPVPQGPGAITVLLVDDGQMSPMQAVRLRPALKTLINTIAERSGALALIAPWSKITLAQEVEGNRALFAAAVDKIIGRRVEDRSTFPVSDAEAIAVQRGDRSMADRLVARFVALNPGFDPDQAAALVASRTVEVARDAKIRREDLYGVMLNSLDWLAKQPGRHSVVMVSGGFAYDSDDSTRQEEVVTRSLRANAPIHFLDVRGLAGLGRFQGVEYGPALDRDAGETPFAFSEAAEGSSNMAADTGGLTIRNTNDMTKGLTRLLDMTTTYYILGYEPPDHKKRGFRKIKVDVLPKGLHVLARRGYFDEASDPR
ncbi:MAG: VWA domain-containing protein [Vicinamibacteria bacterium]|nr:VWA domain-containing protein [Vicinamibacteria bacterium]